MYELWTKAFLETRQPTLLNYKRNMKPCYTWTSHPLCVFKDFDSEGFMME